MMLHDLFANVCDIDSRIKDGTITTGEIIDLYKGKEWAIVQPCEDHHGCEFILTSNDIMNETDETKRMLAKNCYIDFCGCLVITV